MSDVRDDALSRAIELRAQAADKRRMAAVARRVGPSLSQSQDRAVMLQTAQQLEAEAAGLDAQAESIERSQSS